MSVTASGTGCAPSGSAPVADTQPQSSSSLSFAPKVAVSTSTGGRTWGNTTEASVLVTLTRLCNRG